MGRGEPPESSGDPEGSAGASESVWEVGVHRSPARPDWVERGRLLDALDRAVQRPVVLVSAAAGYGKTTLVAQWLEARHSPSMTSAWVTLAAVDNDPGVLCGHLATALEKAGCRAAGRCGRSHSHRARELGRGFPVEIDHSDGGHARGGCPGPGRLPRGAGADLPEARAVPHRASSAPGPRVDRDACRSRPATGTATGGRPAGRDPGRGPGVRHRRGPCAAGDPTGGAVRRDGGATAGPHRRVAGRLGPCHPVAGGPGRSRGVRP